MIKYDADCICKKNNTGIKLDLFPGTAQVIILCTCPYIDLNTSKNLTPPPKNPGSTSIRVDLKCLHYCLKGQRD